MHLFHQNSKQSPQFYLCLLRRQLVGLMPIEYVVDNRQHYFLITGLLTGFFGSRGIISFIINIGNKLIVSKIV
jgi:hypothetical protein